jgi:hypothetical protein
MNIFQQSIGAMKDVIRAADRETETGPAVGEPESTTETSGLPSSNT